MPGEFVDNPDYRWDVYNQTRTAGAQPQLSRFPVSSDAWRDENHRSFVSMAGSGSAVARFNRDPNFVHAEFYDNAWQKVRDLQARQAMGLDYRGPLTIQAYGGSRWKTHIYVDPSNNVVANSKYTMHGARPGNRHTFTMGDDGRFHVTDDYGKVLRVGNDGYVYVAALPSNSNSFNGVFAYDGHHLIHQEDNKFLTVGKSVFTPFVTVDDCGSRSDWRLEKPDGSRANPPQANAHTFRGKSVGSSGKLYLFDKDPDSALPETATHFVTRMPISAYRGNFLDYVKRVRPEEARNAARWLHSQNAAWLFKDGYYAISDASGQLEVRTLDGTPAWRAGANWRSGGERPGLLAQLPADYEVGQTAWQRVVQRESRRGYLENLLSHAYFVNR